MLDKTFDLLPNHFTEYQQQPKEVGYSVTLGFYGTKMQIAVFRFLSGAEAFIESQQDRAPYYTIDVIPYTWPIV